MMRSLMFWFPTIQYKASAAAPSVLIRVHSNPPFPLTVYISTVWSTLWFGWSQYGKPISLWIAEPFLAIKIANSRSTSGSGSWRTSTR